MSSLVTRKVCVELRIKQHIYLCGLHWRVRFLIRTEVFCHFICVEESSIRTEGWVFDFYWGFTTLFSDPKTYVCNPYTRKRLQFSLPEELSICIVRTVSNSHSRKCFRCVLTDYFSIRIDRSFRFVSFDLYWRKVFDPYPNPKSIRLLSFEDFTVLQLVSKKKMFFFQKSTTVSWKNFRIS